MNESGERNEVLILVSPDFPILETVRLGSEGDWLWNWIWSLERLRFFRCG